MTEIPRRARRPLASALLLVITTAPAGAAAWTLDATTWARPRSGAAILSMPPLTEVVAAWSSRPGDTILIRHPGGEAGELWATELRDWLVALGVPGSSVSLIGGGEPERLALAIR